MGGTPTRRPTMNPAGVEASPPFEIRVEPIARKAPPDSPGPFPASFIGVLRSRKKVRGHGRGGMRIGTIGAGNVAGTPGTGKDPGAGGSEGKPRNRGSRRGGPQGPARRGTHTERRSR